MSPNFAALASDAIYRFGSPYELHAIVPSGSQFIAEGYDLESLLRLPLDRISLVRPATGGMIVIRTDRLTTVIAQATRGPREIWEGDRRGYFDWAPPTGSLVEPITELQRLLTWPLVRPSAQELSGRLLLDRLVDRVLDRPSDADVLVELYVSGRWRALAEVLGQSVPPTAPTFADIALVVGLDLATVDGGPDAWSHALHHRVLPRWAAAADLRHVTERCDLADALMDADPPAANTGG